MSSNAASALFLECYRRAAATDDGLAHEVALLAKVSLTDPSARTLYLASRATVTPDLQVWENAILSASPLRAPGDWLSPGVDLVSGDLTLGKHRLSWQAAGKTLFDTFVDFQWYGAQIVLYLWMESIRARGGTFAADALPLVTATLNRPIFTPTTVRVNFRQGTTWRKRVPVRSVNKVDYPARPVASDGVPIPIVMGEYRNIGMRNPPWTSPYPNATTWDESGAGSGVIPGVVVDTGIGGAKVKVLFASHTLRKIADPTNGYSPFLRGDRVLALLDGTGLTTIGTSLEGGFTVADETMIAYAAVLPTDVRVTSPTGVNSAGNPRNAMEVFDETSYAVIDQGAGKNALQLFLPNLSSLGYILGVEAVVAFTGDAANTQNLQVYPYNPQLGTNGAVVAGAALGTTGAILRGAWDAAWWTQDWTFGGSGGGATSAVDLRISFAGAVAANKAHILWACLVVQYQPSRSVVAPGTPAQGSSADRYYDPSGRRVTKKQAQLGGFYVGAKDRIDPVYELSTDFFANVAGQADDGSGGYTGAANVTIERPPDVVHWLLRNYGGAVLGDMEVGAGVFGSFVDARDGIRDGQPAAEHIACLISQFTDLGAVLAYIGGQALALIQRDRFSNKWHFLPWRNGARTDYDRIVQRDDLIELRAECTSDTDIVQAIRVRYRQDYFRNRNTLETVLTPDVSTRGYNDADQKDENCIVVAATNDKLDWTGAATYADTLTPGTYEPIALATEARTQMRTHDANMHVGYGFRLRAGEIIDFKAGGGALTAAVAATADTSAAAAIEAERALNAAAAGTGRTFSVVYLDASNKFKVTAAGGTFELLGATGANYATSALATLGIVADSGAVSAYTATLARYGGRYWDYTKTGNTTLLWKTGTNVATNCGYLLGYGRSADAAAAASHYGTYQVGNRQQQAAASVATYGEKRELVIAADYVREENVAAALLRRIFDLRSAQRVRVEFTTRRMPDVRRGAVIELSSDIDAWVPFPRSGGGGSWARKPLRVVEVEQSLGPLWHQRIVAIEA